MIEVVLPAGPVSVRTVADDADSPWAVTALAHGSGASMEHPFYAGYAAALAAAGVSVLRFNFPYIEAGRKLPGPAAHAISTWGAVMTALAQRNPSLPLFATGKSYGARMASMAAADGVIAPAGLVYLGYPLHPPGQPEKPRLEHLPRIAQPQLYMEGTRDPFIQPVAQLEQAVASCQDASLHWIEGGGHSFEVAGGPRDPEQIGAGLAEIVLPWMRARV